MAGLMVWTLAGWPAEVFAEGPGEASAVVVDGRGDWGAAWETLRERRAGLASLVEFEQRLAVVDQVAEELRAGFEQRRAEALAALLGETLGEAGADQTQVVGEAERTAGAVYRRYRAAFAQPLSAEGLEAGEVDVLRGVYNAKLEEAGREIAERGREVAAAEPGDARGAAAFALVIPLLHVDDEQWGEAEVSGLPDWIRAGGLLSEMEDVALGLGRPRTAYWLAKAAGDDGREELAGLAVYLGSTSDRLLRADRFDEAVACLTALVVEHEAAGETAEATAVRFRLAEVLSDVDRPGEAAEVLGPLLEGDEIDEVGRAAMLSLKCRYEQRDFEAVFALSDRFTPEGAAGSYRPQVLYISWIAANQDGRAVLAAGYRQAFLADYPGHALAADFYFAQAMEALQISDYQQATQVLEYLAYQYPESRLAPRAREICKRLSEQRESKKETSSQP